MNNIFNADSTIKLKELENESVNLVVTSPPYADKRKKYYDSIHPDKYVEWFLPISQELIRILKPDGTFILNIKEHARNGERETYVLELILALKKQGWKWIEEFCWYKKNSFPGKWPNRFRDSWERCLHFTKNKKFKMFQDNVKVPIGDWAKKRFKTMSKKDFERHISNTNGTLGRNVANWLERKTVNPHNTLVFEDEHYVKYQDLDSNIVNSKNGIDFLKITDSIPNIIELATVCHNNTHSAAFPLELPTWFISLFTEKDDIVLDPFLGIGTTALASMLLNRKYIGIEKNLNYFNQASENIRDLENELKVKYYATKN
jgi:site-specific DNA-methyltransferase (adenine-specific)